MKRFLCWIIPMALAAGAGAMLKADDTSPLPSQDIPRNMTGSPEYLWSLEHYTILAKDPEAMGVASVGQSMELLKPQGANVQIDFLMKMLYMTKSHAVERAIRIELAQLYRDTNQQNKAIEQYQELMTESP